MINKIVFDLDGTLNNPDHRDYILKQRLPDGRIDWDKFHEQGKHDPVVEPIAAIFKAFHQTLRVTSNYTLEIWTAREDKWYAETRDWLDKHGISPTRLRMRKTGDYRSSEEVKLDMLNECGFVPDLVFEDRAKMVYFFRNKGITCVQVADHIY